MCKGVVNGVRDRFTALTMTGGGGALPKAWQRHPTSKLMNEREIATAFSDNNAVKIERDKSRVKKISTASYFCSTTLSNVNTALAPSFALTISWICSPGSVPPLNWFTISPLMLK